MIHPTTMATSHGIQHPSRGSIPYGGTAPVDIKAAVQPLPRITRLLSNNPKQFIMGACPTCKKQFKEWKVMKAHAKECFLKHQHPLLMRTCYCPFCLKKLSDAYLLSAHIQRNHSSNLHSLMDKCNGDVIVEVEGINVDKMPDEPFPFICNACKLCWPTAIGVAEHFTAMKKKARPCGGTLVVFISQVAASVSQIRSSKIVERYDFDGEKSCPYCPKTFGEAYVLDTHIKVDHAKHQEDLERKLAPQIENNPIKKHHYAPFFCSTCRSSFKGMDEWAKHYHDNIMDGSPCYGDVRVVKFSKSQSGKPCFVFNDARRVRNPEGSASNGDPRVTQKGSNKQGPNTDPKNEKEHGSDESFDTSDQRIKDEPMDHGEAVVEYQAHTYNTESNARKENADTREDENIPDDPPPRSSEKPVVKDKPLDEESTTCEDGKVKEERDENPSTSISPTIPQTAPPPAEEEKEEYDCEECNITFDNQKSYVEHMKIHGYELADDMDEEEIAKIEASDDIAGPSAKKMKMNEPIVSRTSAPTATYRNPLNGMFECQHCPKKFSNVGEYNRHMLNYHDSTSQGPSLPFHCTLCHRRKFATDEERMKHEKACILYKLSEARDRAFNEASKCMYCMLFCANSFVLSQHLRAFHEDTIDTLRDKYLMAPEFLPFRCSECKVGFEDPHNLLDHFQIREEFGIPCTGNLLLHSYKNTVVQSFQEKDRHPFPLIPKKSDLLDPAYDIYDDVNSDEWCPRDPKPLNEVERTFKVQCPQCTEIWPRQQIKLHVKMEHPKYYYEMSSFKCKTCKQYGFFCPSRYEEHYETCTPASIGVADKRELVCASRCDLDMKKPTAEIWKLPMVPENMGNEVRSCRFCKEPFSPYGMLLHRKKEHPVEHFTDAPYHCQMCGDVGFYRHEDFKSHQHKCTEANPLALMNNMFAITVMEAETRIKRKDVPGFRALIDSDRRKNGAFTALRRPLKCTLCDMWCSSMFTLAEHFRDGHKNRNKDSIPFNCSGCGFLFDNVYNLRLHMENEDKRGNTLCYDKAVVQRIGITGMHTFPNTIAPMDPSVHIRTTPLIAPRYHQPQEGGQHDMVSSVFANWRNEVGLEGRRDYNQQNGFLNLARQQAAEKKRQPTQLLPIRPLNIMSKSPLSGERTLYRQQQIESSINRTSTYFKQVTALQNQRQLVRVDPLEPLVIKPHLLTGASTSGMQSTNSPLSNRSGPSTGPHSSSSFAPRPSQFAPTMRFRPMQHHRISPPPKLEPQVRPPAPVGRRTMAKRDPKEEPIQID